MKKTKHWAFSYIILFAITLISCICLFIFLGSAAGDPRNPLHFLLLSLLVSITWIPGVVGIFFARKEGIRFPVFRKPDRFFFLAPIAAIVIFAVAILCSLPFTSFAESIPFFRGESGMQRVGSFFLVLLVFYIAGLTSNMIVTLGEEIYWRGYLWEKLKNKGAFWAIGITGLSWGIWRLPAMILFEHTYPGRPFWGSLVVILFALAFSFPVTYFRLKGKSVMTAAALHGSFYAFLGIYPLILAPSTNIFVGPMGLIGIGVIALFSLVFGLFSPSRWKKLV